MSSKQLLSQILRHQLLASSLDCPKYKALEDSTMIESEDIEKEKNACERAPVPRKLNYIVGASISPLPEHVLVGFVNALLLISLPASTG